MTTGNSESISGRSPFGELLVTLRTRRGLTQERLAQATEGDRISARSITNYEHSAIHPKYWVLPHRTGLRLLVQALELDRVDHHALISAWNTSRKIRDSITSNEKNKQFVAAGRETVIQNIMGAWTKVQHGEPGFVFVSGVSGTGKTALVRHVCDKIAASTKQVMISWGGTTSRASEIDPYLAIRSATDRILEQPDPASSLHGTYPSRPTLSSANIERIVESIPLLAGALISERAIRSLQVDADDDLATTIGDKLAGRSSTEMAGRLEEYCRLLVHLSKSWPIVLVLEDMHWSGDPSANLLLHLVHHLQNMRETPILIICTYRNDEVQPPHNGQNHPFTRLLDSVSHAPHVQVETMNNSMSESNGVAYIRGIVNQNRMVSTENAEQLVDWLYSQTSGHALLTDELMRHLVKMKTLTVLKDSRWRFDLEHLPERPPDSISAFMEQHLVRLERRSRRILEIASVMDDVILTEIIAEMMEMAEEDVLDIIDIELVEATNLLVPGTALSLRQQSHTSYRFPHALFREHIYNKLTNPRRRNLHQSIAQAAEQRYTDADTTALAEITSHYVFAEDWHSAQMAGYRLAQHAVIKLDWDLAELWFQKAEELAIKAHDPRQLWRTRAARLAMFRGTGRYDTAIEQGERILELGDIHNWPATLALTYHHLGEIYYDLGKVDKAVEYLNKALTLHLEEDSLDLASAGYAMLSHATYRQGKYDIAHEHALAALKLSRELTNSWVMPEAVLAAANCEIDLGYYQKAIQNYQLATELAVMIGKLHNEFIPRMNIGLCYVFMRDYKTAIDVLTDVIQEMEAQTIDRLTAPARLYLGYALEGEGLLEVAAASYAATAEIRRSNLPPPTLYDAVAGQMRIAVLQKDDAAARNWLSEITTHIEQNGWEGIEYPLLVKRSIADASRYFGDETAYRSYIERAYTLMMERAEMIQNEESRTSYLTNVPINVELQQRHAEFE